MTFLRDDQYSVAATSDSAGNIVERVRYDAWGGPTFINSAGVESNTSFIGNLFAFTGRRWEPETRLYYYRYRYFDPQLGRFTTRDPIGIWGDALNLGNGFGYTKNNPWSYVDPYGLCIQWIMDAANDAGGTVELGPGVTERTGGSAKDDKVDAIYEAHKKAERIAAINRVVDRMHEAGETVESAIRFHPGVDAVSGTGEFIAEVEDNGFFSQNTLTAGLGIAVGVVLGKKRKMELTIGLRIHEQMRKKI